MDATFLEENGLLAITARNRAVISGIKWRYGGLSRRILKCARCSNLHYLHYNNNKSRIAYCRKCYNPKCERVGNMNHHFCFPLTMEERELAKRLIDPEAKITLVPLFTDDFLIAEYKNPPCIEKYSIIELRKKRIGLRQRKIYCGVCYDTECMRVAHCNGESCIDQTKREKGETDIVPVITHKFLNNVDDRCIREFIATARASHKLVPL